MFKRPIMKITLKKLDPGQINEKKYEAKVVKEGTRYASRRQPGNRSSSTLGRETSNVTMVAPQNRRSRPAILQNIFIQSTFQKKKEIQSTTELCSLNDCQRKYRQKLSDCFQTQRAKILHHKRVVHTSTQF